MKITDFQDKETLSQIVEYDSIPRMWEASVGRYKDCPAVKSDGKTLSYGELGQLVDKFRAYLYAEAYRPGDSIRITSERSAAFIKAFLAAETLGLTVTVLPEGSREDSLTPEQYGKDLGGAYCSICYPERESPAAVMFTGGTTGTPKGAILSHRCVMTAVRNACYGYPNVFGQKYFHILPMHHVFGLIRSMLTCLATGGELLLCSDPRQMFSMMMQENPTIAVLVPLLVDRGVMLSASYGRSMFGNAMKTIITGAAPVPAHLAEDCAALGISLCPGYGLTETACLVSGNPDMIHHPDSVGLLYPDQEVRFVDGELQIKGKNLMSSYTPGGESGFTEDGWFATGDVGYLDDDGFLCLLGRKKEMLLTAHGENIYPAPVEAKFNALPEVAECELFEAADGTLHLEVLPRDPKQSLCAGSDRYAALMKKLTEVNESLPKLQQASEIILRSEDFPRTASLKMIRKGTLNG